MIPSSNTKLMARINSKPSSRGIHTYNRYFELSGTDALCLPLHSDNLEGLLAGMRALNFQGAITVGFESDSKLFELVDNIGGIADQIDVIGFVTLRDGKYTGDAQGGTGLLSAILEHTDLGGKKIVILGAGRLTRGFLARTAAQGIKPESVSLFNKTPERAEQLAQQHDFVTEFGGMDDFEQAEGDILINSTSIGTAWVQEPDYEFSEQLISRYDYIVDVNFIPLKPQLILLAEKLGKKAIPGWVTFKHGTAMCLQNILDTDIDLKLLETAVLEEFGE